MNHTPEWLRKYMPIFPSTFAGEDPEDLDIQLAAAKHSLRKWLGYRKQKGEPHSGNCALCCLTNDNCELCPLARVRADEDADWVTCDVRRNDEELTPYHEYINSSDIYGAPHKPNPEPMIYWLTLTVRRLVREKFPNHAAILPPIKVKPYVP